MATATLVSIRKGIMVLGLCASMAAASLGFSGQAEARVAEGDRMTPSATVCGAIQDLWDAAQIRKANTHVTADWNKIVREIEELESQWRRAGCGEHYGT
ncbi:MAG TPA: hypothetical protein VJB57_14370, partial [Dehalococcoidia bacterium]|nr:hypothetical protein [Dehalococcoidia bacterium]